MSTQPTLTKRQLREQRRAERVAAERAEAAAAVRRTRTWRLLAAAGLAVVVAGVAALVSSSGGEQPAATTPPAQAATLFDGIEERNGVLGDPDAPLTMTEYVDLQCPVCATAARDTLPTLVRDYVRTGKVKLEARLLHFIGPDSVRAARVAAAAESQGRLWPFLEAFYAAQGRENSGYVNDEFLRSVAASAGVDAAAALEAADGARAQERLNRANADAQTLGIDSTPTFTVARGDGKPHVLAAGAQDPATLAAAIERELAR
jgi:protein-disulfide isomerase